MHGEHHQTDSSRRDFLKQTLKATGYVVPVVLLFNMGSTNSWAQNYEQTTARRRNSNNSCDHAVEKVFNTSCW